MTARRRVGAHVTQAALGLLALVSAGCSGAQSALDPHGVSAQKIATLFWIMTISGSVIFVAFVGLAVYAVYARRRPHSLTFARGLIIGGAVVVPTVLLAVLLVYGLSMLTDYVEPAPAGSLRIHVTGHQWWWRVRYEPPGGTPFDSANELRLPVDQPVQLVLDAPDVIHSLWIPSLAGKMDMIPGRTTQLALTPTRVGTYRGVCAEYCGTSHAWMAFPVVVLDAPAFAAWQKDQASDARATESAGQAAFVENGCGACHAVRGTSARGVIGPDLTHLGSRLSVGAGLLARNEQTLEDFLRRTGELKPGVHMPAFGMLAPGTLRDLALYLESLK